MITGKVEHWRDDVIGLRPVYTERGNATELMLRSGEVKVDERGIKSVLAALARSYAIDFKAQRVQLGKVLQKQANLPFHLGSERIFVPLKMRRAVTDNDQVYGYVDVRCLDEPRAGAEGQCLVMLKTGLELEVLSSVTTAAASRHTGLRLLEILNADSGRKAEEQQALDVIFRLIHCLTDMRDRLRRIEHKLDRQVAEPDGGYTP